MAASLNPLNLDAAPAEPRSGRATALCMAAMDASLNPLNLESPSTRRGQVEPRMACGGTTTMAAWPLLTPEWSRIE